MFFISGVVLATIWGTVSVILVGGYAGLASNPWIGYVFWFFVLVSALVQFYHAIPRLMDAIHSFQHHDHSHGHLDLRKFHRLHHHRH
jgi:hypothetical protein